MKDSAILNKEDKESNFFITLLKGTLTSLSMCLVLVLIFAFILRFIAIPDSAIKPINQIIKCLSILFGSFMALKKNKQMGLITGLIVGILFTVISFLVFSLLDGHIELSKTLVNDIFFGAVIGAICGIIAVSVGKRN